MTKAINYDLQLLRRGGMTKEKFDRNTTVGLWIGPLGKAIYRKRYEQREKQN